jgi:hypothetical protein
MDRIHNILNSIKQEISEAAQKTYKGQKRSELKDSDFLFPETRSFPIVTPQDIPDAISNFGRMKSTMSYDTFLRKLYNMAKKKGPEFIAALPKSSKEKLGINNKTDATIVPLPVTQVVPTETDNNSRLIKTELVDESHNDNEAQKQKTYINNLVPQSPNNEISIPHAVVALNSYQFKAGDLVRNINQSCMHYGSEGIVQNIEELPDHMGQVVVYKTTNAGPSWEPGTILKKTENQLANLQLLQRREPSLTINEIEEPSDLLAQEDEENNEEYEEDEQESEDNDMEHELKEYKEDFFSMSVGSLRAIATHANEILGALENPRVKENLTESWLQGKIAVTEDYMRTIHDFIMYVSESADTISAADRPGLWENIRKKKEREGKKYKPAKPGDKDRPDSKQWQRLQQESKK